jgi:ribonucleoside-diphosphate reductase alpha chain
VEGIEAELKIYVSTGEYTDGRVAEIFLKGDRAGSTISGLLDALSITASLALQSGVPVETLVEKWERMQFEPAGTTTDPELPRVSSIVDAIARWLRRRYCPGTDEASQKLDGQKAKENDNDDGTRTRQRW